MVGPVGPGAGCSVGVVGSGCGVVVPVGPVAPDVPPVLVAPVELLVGFGEVAPVAPVVPVLPVTPVGEGLLVGVSFLGATVGFSSCFSSG